MSPNLGAPAAPMGAELPEPPAPGGWGQHHPLGGATIALPLGQDPSLGQIRGPVDFRNRHNRQLHPHLLKMIKSKEKPPKKNPPRAERFGFPASYNPRLGLVSSFPPIAHRIGPLQTPTGQISPPVIPPSPPQIWGTVTPTLLPLPSPGLLPWWGPHSGRSPGRDLAVGRGTPHPL